MSQFGMQMPGGRGRSGPTPDVFTALMFVACIAMLVACGVLQKGIEGHDDQAQVVPILLVIAGPQVRGKLHPGMVEDGTEPVLRGVLRQHEPSR